MLFFSVSAKLDPPALFAADVPGVTPPPESLPTLKLLFTPSIMIQIYASNRRLEFSIALLVSIMVMFASYAREASSMFTDSIARSTFG